MATAAIFSAGWVLLYALGALAIDDGTAPSGDRPAETVATAGGMKPGISFARCHFQKTPPFEPRVKLECGPGEVVVAVFADGIRCCELELR